MLQQIVVRCAPIVLADDEHLQNGIDRRRRLDDATGPERVGQHELGTNLGGSPRDLL